MGKTEDKTAYMIGVGKEIREKYKSTAEEACAFAVRQWQQSSFQLDWDKAKWFNNLSDKQKMYIYEQIEPTASQYTSEYNPFYSLRTPEDREKVVAAVQKLLKGNAFVIVYSEEGELQPKIEIEHLDHSEGEPIFLEVNRLYIRCSKSLYFFDWELDEIDGVMVGRNVFEVRYRRKKFIQDDYWRMIRTFQVLGSLNVDGVTCTINFNTGR